MATEFPIDQNPGEVIDIAKWDPDTEFEYSLQGAKPKRTIICPNPPPRGFLIGGHRYIFKAPAGRAIHQIWSEVIAYDLGKAIGIRVPPAFLAVDTATGTPGVLIEFFYGYQLQPSDRLVHAIDAFQGAGHPVDFDHGSLRDNVALCRALKIVNWKNWWAQTVAFDSVTGNTDRHSANWGFLVSGNVNDIQRYSLAPAFDNGTSLGFGIREQDLSHFASQAVFQRFVDKGTHHVNWLSGQSQGAPFADLCRRFNAVFGVDDGGMEGAMSLTDSVVDGIIEDCVRFDFPVPFTAQRGEFVARLIKARRAALAAALGG